MPPRRGILFDFDGTLYGDWRLWIATIQATLQSFQVDVTAYDALERARKMIDNGTFVNISGVAVAIARDEGVDKEQEVRAAFLQRLDQTMDSTGPGEMLELLDDLQKRDFLLALVTFMRRPRLIRRLEKWRMAGYFKSIMTPEEWSEFKPSPKPFLKAVEELGPLAPSDCCAVGDEPVDVQGAKAAGVYAIGIAQGFFSEDELKRSGADKIIQSLEQLPSILEQRDLTS